MGGMGFLIFEKKFPAGAMVGFTCKRKRFCHYENFWKKF